MNFLAPWFLVGGLALGLPWLFHLVRRTTRNQIPFSSLLFLRSTPPRLTSRSRLEDFILLALRCLALLLIVLGFARPFLPRVELPTSAVAPQRILILMDCSASVRRSGLWEQARQRTRSIVNQASDLDQVALYTFDRGLHPLLTFSEWQSTPPNARKSLASQRLSDASPSWSGTYTGEALAQAAELLADLGGEKVTPSRRQLILVSDQQEGSRMEALASYEWPPGLDLILEPLKPAASSNAGLEWIAPGADATATDLESTRVRVTNASDSAKDRFQVGWASEDGRTFAGKPMELTVPAGQGQTALLPPRPRDTIHRILLRGDDEDFDNTVHVIPTVAVHLRVVYLGRDTGSDPRQSLFFLRGALAPAGRRTTTIDVVDPANSASTLPLNDANLVIVTEPIPDPWIDVLRTHIEAGVPLLFAPKEASSFSNLARLLRVDSLAVQEVVAPDYQLLGDIDFQHPLFAPFSDPQFRDFTKIHFWKYRRIDPSAVPKSRVIARFDQKDPAIIDVSLGQGRVIVLTSGWTPDDSQLALSTKFVPLLTHLLEGNPTESRSSPVMQVGDPIVFAARTQPRQMLLPDLTRLAVPAGSTQFNGTLAPGIYRLMDDGNGTLSWAVNLDPAESRTAPLNVEEWNRLGLPLNKRAVARTSAAGLTSPPPGMETEGRQKLWRWFILATLLVLVVESIVAGQTGAPRHSAKEALV